LLQNSLNNSTFENQVDHQEGYLQEAS